MPRRALYAAVVAALAMVGACSNTSSAVNRRPHTGVVTAGADISGIEHVVVTAGDDFRFNPSTIYVHSGKTVRITLVHTGTGAPHNWQLTKMPSAFVPLLTAQGEEGSTTFVAPAPGRYQYVCTIHLRQGQTGTLVVLP